MTLASIAFAYLRSNPLTTALHIILMMVGMALLSVLLMFGQQLHDRLLHDARNIDAVVGAKGSPLQLILSSVQHMDVPTGNIPLTTLENLRHDRSIKQAIPLALGDNVRGFRIVGSEAAYISHFGATFAAGALWQRPMQAVLGADVARSLKLNVGDSFVGSHGLVANGDEHKENPYTVVGILQPTHSVLDRLVVTSMESVWDIHHHHDEVEAVETHEHEYHHEHEAHDAVKQPKDTREITAILISYSNRAAALSFPRRFNQDTPYMAASPAFELAKLMELVGISRDTIMTAGGFIIAVALISVFVGLLTATQARRYDMSVLRALGATRGHIMRLILWEGMSIAVIGSPLGIVLGHGIMLWISTHTTHGAHMQLHPFTFLPQEIAVWAAVLVCAMVACILPALHAARTPLLTSLRHA